MRGYFSDTWLKVRLAVIAALRLATLTLESGSREPQESTMKEGIHPDYREVVFADLQTGSKFITRSTVQTRETIELDGKTYPLFARRDVRIAPVLHGRPDPHRRNRPRGKFRACFARTAGTVKSAS